MFALNSSSPLPPPYHFQIFKSLLDKGEIDGSIPAGKKTQARAAGQQTRLRLLANIEMMLRRGLYTLPSPIEP